jgi:hypothetical protein
MDRRDDVRNVAHIGRTRAHGGVRLARLSPEAKGEWGKMSAPQVVCHLAESLKMALGDLPVASRHLPIRYPPLKQFIVYVAPFPKSAPTVRLSFA